MKKKGVIFAIALCSFIVACSTTTHFNSNVPVDVYVDGKYVGRTPNATVSLSDAVWGNPECYAVDESGNRKYYQIRREVKIGAVIGGFFLWPIWLWAYGPAETQYINVDTGYNNNNYNNNNNNAANTNAGIINQQQPQRAATQQPAAYVDQNGQVYYLDRNGLPYYLDENGQPFYYDENGQTFYLDPNSL